MRLPLNPNFPGPTHVGGPLNPKLVGLGGSGIPGAVVSRVHRL